MPIFALRFLALSIAGCSGNQSNQNQTFDSISTRQEKTEMPVSVSATDRNLNLAGAPNARDLGGIVNKDGKKVKSNLLIRTDQLAALTDQDLKQLANVPVRTVVDFRTESEIKSNPDKNPSSVEKTEKIAVLSGNLEVAMKDVMTGEVKLDDYMVDMYKSFAEDPEIIQKYNNFFKLVQDPDNNAILYHCTAGKDRTGVATAFILSALDVSYDEIMSDYLASNEHPVPLPDDIFQEHPELKDHPDLKDATGVKAKYLDATFNEINEKYGNVQDFLTQQLGVDISKMQELYLEK